MYAPACSSASGSPPSSPASSTAAASSAGPAAPVRSSRNPAATSRSSTGTSSTCRPGQDPNWLVITTRPRRPAAPAPPPPPGPARYRRPAASHRGGPAPRAPAPPDHRRPVPGAQVRGQLGEPGRQPGRVLGRQLPHHPQPGRLPVRVLHRHAGLARTPQPAQHHHPRPRPGAPAGHPARPAAPPGPPGTPAAAPAAPPPRHHPAPRPGLPGRQRLQGRQRLEQQRLQPVRGIHRLHRDPGVLHPVPERPLPLPVHRIGQEHPRQRQDRVLIQHEHQPRQAQLPGRGELQLRIGQPGSSRTGEPYRNPMIPAYTSARPTCSRQ